MYNIGMSGEEFAKDVHRTMIGCSLAIFLVGFLAGMAVYNYL